VIPYKYLNPRAQKTILFIEKKRKEKSTSKGTGAGYKMISNHKAVKLDNKS